MSFLRKAAGGYLGLYCVALWLAVLSGCAASTKDIRMSSLVAGKQMRQMNREIGRRTVQLTLRDGRSFMARGAVVSPDSTFWRSPESGSEIGISTAEVHRIGFNSRASGAKRGLTIGAMIGLPAGALLIDDQKGGTGGASGRTEAAFAGAVGGALWGVAIGALAGRQMTYFFHLPSSTEVKRSRNSQEATKQERGGFTVRAPTSYLQ